MSFVRRTQTANLPIPWDALCGQDLRDLEANARARAEASRTQAEAEVKAKSKTVITRTTKTITTTVITETSTSKKSAAAPVTAAGTKGPPKSAPLKLQKDDDYGSCADNSSDTDSSDGPSDSDSSESTKSSEPGISDPSDHDSVFLGLRVYTSGGAPAVVEGQLKQKQE